MGQPGGDHERVVEEEGVHLTDLSERLGVQLYQVSVVYQGTTGHLRHALRGTMIKHRFDTSKTKFFFSLTVSRSMHTASFQHSKTKVGQELLFLIRLNKWHTIFFFYRNSVWPKNIF